LKGPNGTATKSKSQTMLQQRVSVKQC